MRGILMDEKERHLLSLIGGMLLLTGTLALLYALWVS